ncbi:MAG: hypothetical protein LAT80_01905 [Balneolaceae bacterium]|nr:hypothetical protein [Balneolaceae bacterium]
MNSFLGFAALFRSLITSIFSLSLVAINFAQMLGNTIEEGTELISLFEALRFR